MESSGIASLESDISDSTESEKQRQLFLIEKGVFSTKTVASSPSIGLDLESLEKDSEKLNRKANKRLRRTLVGRAETMIEKFIGWHRKKKVEKVKTMLDSHFPKLKHSEEEVRNWISLLTEKKEAAMAAGTALLADVENQILLFQNHLEFLDEVVNDVRQLDYDIVREISELKVALHFNQVC
jgi:hypothetical protein